MCSDGIVVKLGKDIGSYGLGSGITQFLDIPYYAFIFGHLKTFN